MSNDRTIPATDERVMEATASEINEKNRREMESRLKQLARGSIADINRRLDELDHEWDIERTLEANAATLSVTGCLLGAVVDKRFFFLPAVVGTFLLQHAVQGWCPPLPILRRMGVRTSKEINDERYALKTIRGDFRDVVGEVGSDNVTNDALSAVRK